MIILDLQSYKTKTSGDFPEVYSVQLLLRVCLITQLLEPQLQELPRLPSSSYDE